MKQKISRILGVGLVIALLSSLLVMAAPAGAYPLLWYAASTAIPTTTDNVLSPAGIDIIDLAIVGDTILAATGDNTTPLYKSSDAGATWSDLSTTTYFPAGKYVKLVTTAPGDAATIAIVTTDNYTYYSSTGGASWINLGYAGGTGTSNINAIDIAAGGLFIVAAGDNGTDAEMWVIYLAMAQSWWAKGRTADAASDMTTIRAVKFSPNYATDNIITVISENGTDAYFEVFRNTAGAYGWNGQIAFFNATDWGTGIQLDTGTYAGGSISGGLGAADIALPSTYLGNDEGERIVYTAIASGNTTAGGVSRLTDSIKTDFRTWSSGDEGPSGSIAYAEDAGILIAGDYDSNQVYRFLSPTAAAPLAERVNSLKQPSGANRTLVGWSGETAVATTSGDESAFAISVDSAYSFNDISMIDTEFSVIDDVAVSADGSKTYLTSHNGTDASVWLKASAWQRIFSTDTGSATTAALLVRIAPEDDSAVYLSSKTTINMWVSKNSGLTTWKSIPAYKLASVQDFAVASADVVYAIDATGLSKTSNAGSSWGTKVTPTSTFTPYMVTVASNGDVLIGGASNYIAFSKDGGATLTRTQQAPTTVSTADVQVVADKDYADNNVIYAGFGRVVARGKADATTTFVARSPSIDSGYSVVGIAQSEGLVYVLTSNSTDSTIFRALNLTPTVVAGLELWSSQTTGYELEATPQALKMSSGQSFYAIDTPNGFASWSDPIGLTAPSLNTPSDAYQVLVNKATGNAYDVAFSVGRPAGDILDSITSYTLILSPNASFSPVFPLVTITATSGIDTSSTIVGPSTQVYFMPGETYYWMVRAAAPMYSPWSEVRSFTIEALEEEVVVAPSLSIVSPLSGATVATEPTFVWTAFEGAINYEVVVSTMADFSIIEYSHTVPVANTFYKSEALAYDTTYYWRVRGVTGAAKAYQPAPGGPWATGVFTTEAEPAEPTPPIVIEPTPEIEIKIVEVPVATPGPETVKVVEVPVQTVLQEEIPDYLLWTIIGIGAALIVSLIILIARTRRVT